MKIIRIAKTFIAYHGTPNKSLDVFDISLSGNGHDQEGPGIYFTSDESDARSYSNGSLGKVIKVKLNLRKTVSIKETD